MPAFRRRRHRHHRITLLLRPGVHDPLDGHSGRERAVLVRGLRQPLPEVILVGDSITRSPHGHLCEDYSPPHVVEVELLS